MATCLWFDGAAEEAAAHYVDVFEDGRLLGVHRSPADNPSTPEGAVLLVTFELGGRRFTALNGGPHFRPTEAVSTEVHCADQAEVDHYATRLTEGGGEEGPCGWVKDRWGFSWQVVPVRLLELLADPDPGRARRAMEAMLGMRRIVVADLEAAADAA
jgi:predicted 3-demethylubiquinone-9 3-methyltransferase (glyoxalase superfamily)